MSNAYYVDTRVGCLAVRKSGSEFVEHTAGLHSDTPGVVKYWHGEPRVEDNRVHWHLSDSVRDEADKLCTDLNSGAVVMDHVPLPAKYEE